MNATHHAVIRYLERVCGHDVEGMRRTDEQDCDLIARFVSDYGLDREALIRELCTPRTTSLARFVRRGRVPIGNGFLAVVDAGVIITIVPAGRGTRNIETRGHV